MHAGLVRTAPLVLAAMFVCGRTIAAGADGAVPRGIAPPAAGAPSPSPLVADGDAAEAVLAALREHVRTLRASGRVDTGVADWRTHLPPPPALTFPADACVYWIVETGMGALRFRLFADAAPRHVINIAYLTEIGFFSEIRFDRIVPAFLAQSGGDRGVPPYALDHEIDPARHPGLEYDRAGLLAMGRHGERSAASIFFVTLGRTPWLAGKHTIAGELVDGHDVLRAIEGRGTSGGTPTQATTLRRASIDAHDAVSVQVARHIDTLTRSGRLDPTRAGPNAPLPPPPRLRFAAGLDYLLDFDTSHGRLRVRLFTDLAPLHAANLVYLTALGFHRGARFDRIVPSFMAQGGATAAGRTDPGYALDDERTPGATFDRPGRLAMGRHGDRSAASLFFLTTAPAPWLDGRHTLAGQLVEGQDTLQRIAAAGDRDGRVATPVTIHDVEVHTARRAHDAVDAAVAQVRAHVGAMTAAGRIDAAAPGRTRRLPMFPDLTFTPGRSYFWDLETSHGAIRVLLLPEIAPRHVANCTYLSEIGFYDGLDFHRVIPGFMAQGGRAPDGAPGYTFAGETHADVKHDRAGVLSAANTGAPGSDASEFFITFRATPWLDGKHTVYGRVVSGMEAVRALEQRGARDGRPSERLGITRARVTVE
jgi:cyclophilin family peptidyl-prolyl cis-trans isomerase